MQLFIARFQREESDTLAQPGQVPAKCERKRRLSGGGIPAQHDHIAALDEEPVIELVQGPGVILMTLMMAGEEILQSFLHGDIFDARPVYQLRGCLCDISLCGLKAPCRLQTAAQLLEAIQPGLLPHDPDMLPYVDRC